MTKPFVHKHDNAWRVTIGTHLYSSHATHADAWRFAEGVAAYARHIRARQALARIRAAIDTMENR